MLMRLVIAFGILVSITGVAVTTPPPTKAKEDPAVPATKEKIVEKLIGKWEVLKADNPAMNGATLHFEKGGKYIYEVEGVKAEGTFEIEDGKLITRIGSASDTDNFKKLNNEELEIINLDKQYTLLKRKKD